MQLALVLGLMLSIILMVVLQFGSRIFTKDINVLQLISLGIPVSLSPSAQAKKQMTFLFLVPIVPG